MKYSERLRRGMAYWSPCKGVYFSRSGLSACVIGSMVRPRVGTSNKAANRIHRKLGNMIAIKTFPARWECLSLSSQILQAFEIHGWTRKRIADALEKAGL